MILLHLFIFSYMCWLKSSLESKMSPRCFWAEIDCILLLIKVKGSWGKLLCLWEKQTSVTCLVGSGLSSIFHWYPHCLISFKSLLGSIWDFSLLIAIKKSDVSSANVLQSEVNQSGKSLIYIRNNNGPKTDPCGTPAKMLFHEDFCPFKRTCCCRFLR